MKILDYLLGLLVLTGGILLILVGVPVVAGLVGVRGAMSEPTFEGWAIVELMGHRKIAGYVTAEELGGTALLRVDVPGTNGKSVATQFYNPSALYCLTPTTEAIARAVAARNDPAPVTRWELPPAPPSIEKEDLFGDL